MLQNNNDNDNNQNIPPKNNQNNQQIPSNQEGNLLNNQRIISSEDQYSFSKYTKPAKTRLKDLSDTSYLNSVLYCLGNIRNIVSYFLNPDNFKKIDNNIKTMSLCFVFERLIYHLYEKDNKEENIYSPESFWKVLSKLNITYKTLQRRNPIDLINYLLSVLHNELNKENKDAILINENNGDKKEVIKNGVKNFKNKENSIISNNLNWFELKEYICQKCKKNFFEFLTFTTFNLDLESTQNLIKANKINIYDCLKNYNKAKKINFFCKNCNANENVVCNSKIFLTSHSLIFLLNREIDFRENNKLLKIKFNIDEKIDLNNFIENDHSPKKYRLIGIISIYLKEKRYVNFCQSPIDKKWYFYNNEKKVEDVNLEEELKEDNKEENEFIPTILVYKECK